MRWTQSVRQLPVLFFVLFAAPLVTADETPCDDEHGYSYLCGVESAEDLVQVPGTRWLVASGFSGGVSLNLINTAERSAHDFYPTHSSTELHDRGRYGNCPGAPDTDNFNAHGLHIRAMPDDHSILYVVGHGARESIEVFEIDASGTTPEIAWVGCVLMPDGMVANSVTSTPDGSLLVTIPLHPGIGIKDIFTRETTGAAYAWSPGDKTFSIIEGTEMRYANGIETSEDGSKFYIASSGHLKIYAFSNENPARLLRSSETLGIVPDNLHRDSKGQLITAGLSVVDPGCGDVLLNETFDLDVFASCNRPFSVISVDPETLELTQLADSPAHKHFSNVTMALEVAGELWVGTFAGDRIAYRSMTSAGD